jgi:hypothetical protein
VLSTKPVALVGVEDSGKRRKQDAARWEWGKQEHVVSGEEGIDSSLE